LYRTISILRLGKVRQKKLRNERCSLSICTGAFPHGAFMHLSALAWPISSFVKSFPQRSVPPFIRSSATGFMDRSAKQLILSSYSLSSSAYQHHWDLACCKSTAAWPMSGGWRIIQAFTYLLSPS